MKPFDFQYRLRDYFKQQEKTWKWFSEVQVKAEQTEQFKTELLKNTYRLDPQAEPALYALLEKAKTKLGIVIPVTVYQSQYSGESNAGIILMDNEAHLLLSGPILGLLDENELLALMAHELSHVLLYTVDGGDFEVTARIIYVIANDYRSDDSYLETARLFSLFTELFCDIGSYTVCGDGNVVISTLVKVQTGLHKVSPESYLKQADEILARENDGSGGDSHPEAHLRAKALQLYMEKGLDAYGEISELIFGKPGLFSLNVFSKVTVQENTRGLIQLLLKPKWMQSDFNKAHYQLYFRNFQLNSDLVLTPEFKERIKHGNAALKDYYAYVMLDFALCDPDISEPASGLVLDLAEQLELVEPVAKAFKKELELSEKKFDEYAKNAASALNRILESERENMYE